MKKLVLFFAVAFAMSFASCGNKAAESTEATDSVAVVEEVAVEVCTRDTEHHTWEESRHIHT